MDGDDKELSCNAGGRDNPRGGFLRWEGEGSVILDEVVAVEAAVAVGVWVREERIALPLKRPIQNMHK